MCVGAASQRRGTQRRRPLQPGAAPCIRPHVHMCAMRTPRSQNNIPSPLRFHRIHSSHMYSPQYMHVHYLRAKSSWRWCAHTSNFLSGGSRTRGPGCRTQTPPRRSACPPHRTVSRYTHIFAVYVVYKCTAAPNYVQNSRAPRQGFPCAPNKLPTVAAAMPFPPGSATATTTTAATTASASTSMSRVARGWSSSLPCRCHWTAVETSARKCMRRPARSHTPGGPVEPASSQPNGANACASVCERMQAVARVHDDGDDGNAHLVC